MKKSFGFYLGIFVAAYIGISILTAVIGAFFSSSMNAMSVLAPFLAANFAGTSFLKQEKRLPTDVERSRLINGSFLIFAAINVLIFVAFALVGGFSSLGLTEASSSIYMIMIAFVAFLFLMAYFMIRLAYGKPLTKQAARLKEKDPSFDSTFD